MEKKDLKTMTFKEVGISITDYTFYSTFKKLGISTLGQLFDDTLMDDIMKRVRILTRTELRNFISLMKCQYLGIPMTSNVYLECEGVLNTDGSYDFEGFDLFKVGFNYVQRSEMYNLMAKYGARIVGMKLIDFFKELVEQNYCSDETRKVLQIYIASYEKEKEAAEEISSNGDSSVLKDEVEKLSAVNNKLDEQIVSIQRNIDELEHVVGGVKK